jgi:hypothetical protein
MNNYNLNAYSDKKYKPVEYGSLKIGDEFFIRKPMLINTGGGYDIDTYKKTISTKVNESTWVNAKTKLGFQTFIPYDKRVFVEVKQ